MNIELSFNIKQREKKEKKKKKKIRTLYVYLLRNVHKLGHFLGQIQDLDPHQNKINCI